MKFTEYLKEQTDICCPVMHKMREETGAWNEADDALQAAIAAGDDDAAKNLVIQMDLMSSWDIEEAEAFDAAAHYQALVDFFTLEGDAMRVKIWQDRLDAYLARQEAV